MLDSLDLDWEVVFIDDGSTDATFATLRAIHAEDRRLKAISLSRNFGKEIAIAAGFGMRGAMWRCRWTRTCSIRPS